MRLFLILMFVLFVLCPKAQANRDAQFSGAYMIHVCSSDDKGQEVVPGGHNACQSYISGVIDYHNTLKGMDTAPSTDFCIPPEEHLIRIQKNVLFYLLKYRAIHSAFVAAPAVNLALHNFYKCK